MKLSLIKIVFVFLLIVNSCNDDLISPPLNIEISDHILDNHFVTSITFDDKGNAWIGTFRQGLIKYDGTIATYDKNNSVLPDSIIINALAIDKNDDLWIGSNKGLIKYDNKNFTIYNKLNAPLFTDNVYALNRG